MPINWDELGIEMQKEIAGMLPAPKRRLMSSQVAGLYRKCLAGITKFRLRLALSRAYSQQKSERLACSSGASLVPGETDVSSRAAALTAAQLAPHSAVGDGLSPKLNQEVNGPY